jgi:hypothetical protein
MGKMDYVSELMGESSICTDIYPVRGKMGKHSQP